ncbi:DNA-binding protein [Colletotrichum tabaci]|uniref:DNA-binding protein n=1 Tax=Colletotrichum tabaci TaxID=1209068 RepID=A0AAV9TKQ9_9PEZI
MVKPADEVFSEFNECVNMTAEELESWLKSGDSNSAGWPKDDAEGDDGETVGHDSGRKIVEILRANPDKKEDAYTEEQVEHMRKVVAYCKRHLAQETKSNSEKSPEEVKKTKSYASLKNWGHDFLKAQGGGSSKGEEAHEKTGSNGSKEKNGSNKKGEEEEEEEEEEEPEQVDDAEEEAAEETEETEEKAGDKRKNASDENGSSKKRQTRQGEGKAAEESEENGGEDGDDDKTTKGPEKGDTVSWNWGNGHPEGKVLDVKGEKTTIETKRGNEVSRDGNPEDPAVVLDTGKSKAIKSAHELNEA